MNLGCRDTKVSEGAGGGRARGYSLLELLIASSLLIIAIIGTGQMILLSWRFKMGSEAASEAADLAVSRAESLRPALMEGSGTAAGSAHVNPAGKAGLAYDLSWSAAERTSGFWEMEICCTPRSLPRKNARLKVYVSALLGF
jgi:Tfp pilus assembly protein PilV